MSEIYCLLEFACANIRPKISLPRGEMHSGQAIPGDKNTHTHKYFEERKKMCAHKHTHTTAMAKYNNIVDQL